MKIWKALYFLVQFVNANMQLKMTHSFISIISLSLKIFLATDWMVWNYVIMFQEAHLFWQCALSRGSAPTKMAAPMWSERIFQSSLISIKPIYCIEYMRNWKGDSTYFSNANACCLCWKCYYLSDLGLGDRESPRLLVQLFFLLILFAAHVNRQWSLTVQTRCT